MQQLCLTETQHTGHAELHGDAAGQAVLAVAVKVAEALAREQAVGLLVDRLLRALPLQAQAMRVSRYSLEAQHGYALKVTRTRRHGCRADAEACSEQAAHTPVHREHSCCTD